MPNNSNPAPSQSRSLQYWGEKFTASTGVFEESFFISFPAAILTNLMGGNHARGRGKMRLLKSKKENIRLFDRMENKAQLGKTYCLENDNGQKITIFFFLVTSTRTMHRDVKCQHFSYVFTYCQRLSLQLHLEKNKKCGHWKQDAVVSDTNRRSNR